MAGSYEFEGDVLLGATPDDGYTLGQGELTTMANFYIEGAPF